MNRIENERQTRGSMEKSEPRLREIGLRFGLALTAVALTILLVAFRATAQGCAMCYQSAAASGSQGNAALRHGILVLLVPALTLFFGICGLIYRRRNVAR